MGGGKGWSGGFGRGGGGGEMLRLFVIVTVCRISLN